MFTGKLDENNRPVMADRPRYKDDDMLGCAYYGETEKVLTALKAGADVNQTDKATGLSALHLAVGTNNLALTKALVEDYGADFFSDRFNRWPSVIAIKLRVSEELTTYIWNAEAKFLGLKT